MLNRFIHSIRGLNQLSGFELYLANVQRHCPSVAPTVEEAKRDYQAIVRLDLPFAL